MEMSPEPPASPSNGSTRVRNVAVAVLAVAGLLLMFGLGYGVNDLTSEDEVRIVTTPGEAQPSQDQPATQQQAQQQSEERSDLAVGVSILEEAFEVLLDEFVDKEILDERDFRDAAIRGAINSLNDPYTEYLSPDDLLRGVGEIESSYEGIGATVTDRTGQIQIGAPFRGSPAERAGIRAGDIILAVDGESTEGWTDQQAVQRIRGPRGTEVVLTVQHTDLGPGPEIEDITIVRDQIRIQSVFTEPRLELIPGETGPDLVDRDGNLVTDILYVNISQFHSDTPNELRSALAEAESGQYIGLILDVRSNPGGLLRQTVEVTDEFLDEGAILREIDADGNVQTFGARPGGVATSIPIVILQDEASASGAEVLAAALVDNGRAIVVGTRSFGKGTVNQLHPLRNCGAPEGCGALYITIGRWLRPDGQAIEGLGIAPNFELSMTGDDYIDFGDLQVFAAIDILRGIEPPPPPDRAADEDDGERPDVPNVIEREDPHATDPEEE